MKREEETGEGGSVCASWRRGLGGDQGLGEACAVVALMEFASPHRSEHMVAGKVALC